jgi:four helix bundle protein
VNRKHRSLKAWQEAMKLVEQVYAKTRAFPKEELFGLTAQMRRAAVSVPANIAEGAARAGTKELLRFVSIAAGSLSELDTHIEIARRLEYLKDEHLDGQVDAVAGLLLGLDASLRKKLKSK